MLEEAGTRDRVLGWVDAPDDDRRGHPRVADRAGLARRPPGAGEAEPDHHPHLRHDRHPQGRAPQRGRHRGRRGAAVPAAAEVRLALARRRAAVPHLGLGALRAGDAARLDGRAAPQVRPRGLPADARRGGLRLAGGDPRDAAADHAAAAGDARPLRPVGASRSSRPPGRRCPATSAPTWMDQFGDHLFNIYGSTEVAYATVASPEDLREAPGTAGRPPFATVVKILDEDGAELPRGEAGRIFVGNSILFEGYTGGGSKDLVDGLMATGDVGRFDEGGRLIVEGRDDDMIVSGGENVFPQEVEDCLSRHDEVVEARGARRRRRGLRQAAARVRRTRRGVAGLAGRAQGLREAEPRALQGAARDRVPRRAAAQRHRQGAQARARRGGPQEAS